ncbi:hypothetical protein Tco_0752794 [Tanacetum coccineum]|uniref:Uncharacterized protein n=1 Tax=Tanacetum coccineum TaxID=301880 RepID=A0ABQ4ZBE4_9ASTR
MHEESDFEAQDMGFDDKDSSSRHIPKVSLNQEWFKPISKEERHATLEPAWSIPSSSLPVPNNNWASAIDSSFVSPPENSLLSHTGDIGVFIDWFCKKQGITELTLEHLEGPAYEVVKAFHPDGDRLALSITKMKAASYPNAGLEQMVPDQMWVEEEYMYDISASYGSKESVTEEILLQRMLEENYDKGHEDHKMAYEALQKSIIRDESEKFDADKAEERTKKKE